jgi:hypothetical protein
MIVMGLFPEKRLIGKDATPLTTGALAFSLVSIVTVPDGSGDASLVTDTDKVRFPEASVVGSDGVRLTDD